MRKSLSLSKAERRKFGIFEKKITLAVMKKLDYVKIRVEIRRSVAIFW